MGYLQIVQITHTVARIAKDSTAHSDWLLPTLV
jgi:hypothetical protein